MKKLFITFSLLALHFSLSAQIWCWGRCGNVNIKADDVGSPVATNKFGNAYITGQFENQIVFGKDTLKDLSDNTYVVKYNASGAVLWAKNPYSWGTTNSFGNGIVSDEFDNVYIAGYFSDTIAFGTDTLNSANGRGFLVKYDPSGNVNWVRQYGGLGQSVIINKHGFIWVGTYGNLYKYSPAGVQVLAKSCLYSPSNGNGMTCDNAGNIFTTTITDTNGITSSARIPVLAKYDSNGNLLWERHPSIASFVCGGWGLSVVTDKENNVYMTGYFMDTLTFSSHTLISPLPNTHLLLGYSIFLAKYDTYGNLIWVKQNIGNQKFRGTSLSRDNNDFIYLGGSGINIDSLNFGGGLLITASTSYDASFIMQLDTAGNYKKGSLLKHGTFNYQPMDFLNQTAVDSTGTIVYLTGSFWNDTVIVNTDTLLDKLGGQAAYLARWNTGQCTTPDGVTSIDKNTESAMLFPNPNRGVFAIKSLVVSGQYSVEVYNMLGEKVYSNTSSIKKSTFNIDISDKPGGVYLYRVITEDGTLVSNGKFIIEK